MSAFVGWFTNVIAVRMMFYPTNFVGIPPFLGWQGIVPANARRLAQYSIRLITTRLVSLTDLFANFSGEDFAKNLDGVVEEVTNQVVQEIAEKHAPLLWANAGEVMQEQLRAKLREEVRAVAVRIADDLGSNITEILDLEQVVLDAVMADRALMSQMFLEVGREEFKFIERSGIWFGGLFGVVQMTIWAVYPEWWILPFFGFLVGYATNWVALKLVFEPKQPTKYGPFVFHGLFHKRQQEVASRFASITSSRVLNADNMTATITTGPSGERVQSIIACHVGELVDRYAEHPMASMVLQPGQSVTLRAELIERVVADIPKPGGLLHVFTARAVDIRKTLEERMQKLDAEAFEGVLRPAFQQDEWKLILAGAVLGLAAGLAQLVYVFGEQVPW
ncbi:MAG: hypothetical protein H5U40_17775 [Polyangiaceae bacterium]|nr:hypothetical protein [Polyangiaceae bacterium]